MSSLDVLLGLFALVLGYGVHRYFNDKREARAHETKLTVEVVAVAKKQTEALVTLGQMFPALDEHVRASLENFRKAMVAALVEQREIVKGLDTENKRVVTGKVAKNLLGGRMPEP